MLRKRYLRMMIFSRQPEETFSFLLSLSMFSKVTAVWSILLPSSFLSLNTRTKFEGVALHLQSSAFISLPITTNNDLFPRNCSFHAAGHRAILSPESAVVSVPPSKITAPGIDALPYILLPLAGPEEFDLEVLIGFPSLNSTAFWLL